ncbi:carboxypeptidase G2 [alpha proteobacterium Q-1]|nr:carboxypeptidase G2 [alpha proteobacterium Q-1]
MNGPMAWDMECFVTPQTMNAVLSDRLFEIKKRHADAFSWLDGQQAAMVDQVIAWSKINSGSGNLDGLRRMGETLEDAFAKTGADCTLLPLSPVRMISLKGEDQSLELGPCRLFSIRPQAPRRILLTGHIDTVFAADHPFQTPRWLDDQTLNGPGVADMKGGLIVMLHALLAVERSGAWEDFDFSDFGWDVLISADEEIGSLGSAAYLAERAAFARIGLTYEPALADGTLAGARKGSGNFSFVVRGRAAHAGREFALGRNAVVMMAELITQLDALNGQRSGVTINPAVIAGGAAPNIVPDSAVLRFNVRVESDADAQWVREGLMAISKDIGAREGFQVSLHGDFNRPPKPIGPRNQALFDIVSACGEAMDIGISYRATGGCCEGNNLAAANLPNVDTLGVRGGDIHSADEYVLVESFAERARLSALIIFGFAHGAFDDLLIGEGA